MMNLENDKSQITNNKQYQSSNTQSSKQYDLEERTLNYAKRVNSFVRKLSRNVSNMENGRQLARSAGSVGANYIEANEALSKKDFCMRVKIARKEAKESRYWLYLTEVRPPEEREKETLIREATELIKIFSSILLKTKTFQT